MFLKDKLIKILKKHYLSLKMVKYQRLLNQALDIILFKADKPTDFNSEKQSLKEKLVDQKVHLKKPKLLTDAYKDLLKEYDVDFKDRDIKSVVEDKILNPEKLKQGGAQGGQSGMSQFTKPSDRIQKYHGRSVFRLKIGQRMLMFQYTHLSDIF